MRFIGLIVLVIIAVAAGAFYALNAEQAVDLNLFVTTVHTPAVLAMVISLAIGVLVGFGVSFVRILGLKSEKRRLERSVQEAETEIENLRKASLEDVG